MFEKSFSVDLCLTTARRFFVQLELGCCCFTDDVMLCYEFLIRNVMSNDVRYQAI